VNELTPPAEEKVEVSTKEDDSSVESAVNFIAGGSENSDNIEVKSEGDDKVEVKTGLNTEENNSQVVVEAPADTVRTEPESVVISDENNNNEESATKSSEDIIEPSNTDSDKISQLAADTSGMSNNEKSQNHEHRNNKKLAVIVTIVVAVLLAAAAVYVFVSAQDNTVQSNSDNVEVNDTMAAEVTPATVEEIDQTISDIDDTINTLDDSLLDESTVTDESLGLQ
jgi:hypothetical protein